MNFTVSRFRDTMKSMEMEHERPQKILPNVRSWYVFRRERHFGPIALDELRQFISDGHLGTEHFVWKSSFYQWKKIGEIDNLKAYANAECIELSDGQFEEILNDKRREKPDEPIDLLLANPIGISFQPPPVFSHSAHQESSISTLHQWKAKKWFRLTVLLISVLAVFYTYHSLKNRATEQVLSELPPQYSKVFRNVISSSSQLPRARIQATNPGEAQPVLVLATNMDIGESLRLEVNGIENTLLNSHRINIINSYKIEDPIFKTDPLKRADGRDLPIGKYEAKVFCTQCPQRQQHLYKYDFTVGNLTDANYVPRLNRYHAKIRLRAKSELMEATEILETLNEQFTKSRAQFRKQSKRPARRNTRSWTQFDLKWRSLQNSIVSLFSKLDEMQFRDDLFYQPIYLSLRVLGNHISQLHSSYAKSLLNSDSWNSQRSNILKNQQEVLAKITTLRSKINLMKLNFENSPTMPSRAGL